MTAFTVDWFVGSIVLPEQVFSIDDGGGADTVTVPAGTYYLRHSSAARSLLTVVANAIDSSASAINVDNSRIQRSRQLLLELDAPASVTWGSATALRDLLGYTANLVSSASHLAPGVSPLLWSPGYPGTTKTIRGVDGYLVPHQVMSKSDDGTQLHTYHFSEETHQDVDWSHLDPSRLRVATGTGGGTFYEFHRQCGMLGARHLYYQDIVEDDADAVTPVTWTTQRGPYVLRPEARSGDWYRRSVPNAEVSSPLALPMQILAEYP